MAAAAPAHIDYQCASCDTFMVRKPDNDAECIQLPCGLFACRFCVRRAVASCREGDEPVLQCPACSAEHSCDLAEENALMVPGWLALTSHALDNAHLDSSCESAPVVESELVGNDSIHAALYSALRVRYRMAAEDAEVLAAILLATYGVSHMQRALAGPARNLQEAVQVAMGQLRESATESEERRHQRRDASTPPGIGESERDYGAADPAPSSRAAAGSAGSVPTRCSASRSPSVPGHRTTAAEPSHSGPAGAGTAPTALSRRGITAVFWDIENCHLGVSDYEHGAAPGGCADDGRVDILRLKQDLLLRLEGMGLYSFGDRADWQ